MRECGREPEREPPDLKIQPCPLSISKLKAFPLTVNKSFTFQSRSVSMPLLSDLPFPSVLLLA